MTIEIARNFFFWCSIINYAMLLLWALPYAFWRDGLYRWWCWWVPVSQEQFNMLNIAGISIYKFAIFLFLLYLQFLSWFFKGGKMLRER